MTLTMVAMVRKELKMVEETKNRKTQGLMYEQQLDHLDITINELVTRVKKLLHIKRYAYITHDRDTHDDGTLIKPHIHLMMQFDIRVRLSAVARQLQVQPQQLEIMTKQGTARGIDNGFAYLCHLTSGAKDKYQYSVDAVKANFDYPAYIEELQQQLESQDTPNAVLDDYGRQIITRQEALNRLRNLGGRVLANNRKKLDEIDAANNELRSQKAIAYQREHPHKRQILFLYGRSGTGKTSFARVLAKKYAKMYGMDENDWTITGSSNDPFEGLRPSAVTIWDEMRSNSRLRYEDILRLLDPNNHDGFMTNSRFHNVNVISSVIIITTPVDPYTLYKDMIEHSNMSRKNDSFYQLARRLTHVYKFEDKTITEMQPKTIDYGMDEYTMYTPTNNIVENKFSHHYRSSKVNNDDDGDNDDPLKMV